MLTDVWQCGGLPIAGIVFFWATDWAVWFTDYCTLVGFMVSNVVHDQCTGEIGPFGWDAQFPDTLLLRGL